MTTRRILMALFCVSCVLAVAMGCNRAKDPAEVRSDVSAARQEANEKVTDARVEAAEKTAEAHREVVEEAKDVAAAQDDATEEVMDANREVAMARIEGEYEVASKRCEALSGDAQSACKAEADAHFERAKSRVESRFN